MTSHKCLHTLKETIESRNDHKVTQELVNLQDLRRIQILDPAALVNANSDTRSTSADPIPSNFLHSCKNNDTIMNTRPWKTNAEYFKKVYISALALMKMTIHAQSGGSIEIMGMLTGKIIEGSIIVMDVYGLPVEGTETRVNAQAEAYEYMVQFLTSLKTEGREENIVGWYHSHPGYGCWLSGIDVATQKLNQDFQDPYLAIVIDPIRTLSQGKVEIGAFRTFPDNYKSKVNKPEEKGPANKAKLNKVKKLKQGDFGIHASRYYSLDIEIFKSLQDEEVLNIIRSEGWMNDLVESINYQNEAIKEVKYKILEIIESLRGHEITPSGKWDKRLSYKFLKDFEPIMASKLLDERLLSKNEGANSNAADTYSGQKRSGLMEINETDDEDVDDSEDSRSECGDGDGKPGLLDIDGDDAMSIESSRPPSRKQIRIPEEDEDANMDVDYTNSKNNRKRVYSAPSTSEADGIRAATPVSNTGSTSTFSPSTPTFNIEKANDLLEEDPDKTVSETELKSFDKLDQFDKHKKLVYANRKKAIRIYNESEPAFESNSSLASGTLSSKRSSVSSKSDSKPRDSLGAVYPLGEKPKYAANTKLKAASYKGLSDIEQNALKLAELELSEYIKIRTQQRIFSP